MWEFLEDWFNQAIRQIELRVQRLKANRPRAFQPEQPASPVEMGNAMLGDAGRSGGFEGILSKLNKLAELHSDEYKDNHPEIFDANGKATTPQHVIVDNAKDLTPGSDDRINGLLDKLKGMHSDEYKQSHPWLFRQRPQQQGSSFTPSTPSRISRWLSKGGRLSQNRVVRMRMGLRRLRRRFTPSPQTMQRMGLWLNQGGRAMQMGAGRLAASGFPGTGYLAAGLGRAGLIAEGSGSAMAGGLSGGVVAGGAALAAVAAVPAFLFASKKMGESMLDSQRYLADWNGSIANSIAQTDIHRMRMDARQAAATDASTERLSSSMREFRETVQPLREVFSVVGLELSNFAVKLANFSMETLISKLPGADLLLQHWNANNQQNGADQPGIAFMKALDRQKIVPRPPLEKIQ